jgi:hypothetical protein
MALLDWLIEALRTDGALALFLSLAMARPSATCCPPCGAR